MGITLVLIISTLLSPSYCSPQFKIPSFEFQPGEPLTPDDFRNARTFPKILINYTIDDIEIDEEVLPDTHQSSPFPGSETTSSTNSPVEKQTTNFPFSDSDNSVDIHTTTMIVNDISAVIDSTSESPSDFDDTENTTSQPSITNITETLEPENTIGTDGNKKWRGGIIPYVLDIEFSEIERAEIAKAILTIRTHTCIRFVPKILDKDYVQFVRNSQSNTCSSSVGRQGRRQSINLSPRCLKEGHILHEMMHSIGFDHEQSRIDRDDFVTIIVDNVKKGSLYNFKKLNRKSGNMEGPYDLKSITHYSKFACGKWAGLVTIVANNPIYTDNMGQREGLSVGDRYKVNKFYNCGILGLLSVQNQIRKAARVKSRTCQDFDKDCQSLSANGNCHNGDAWISANCRKSCNNCDNFCDDFNDKCSAWAREGECLHNQDYMEVYCSRSCRFCYE